MSEENEHLNWLKPCASGACLEWAFSVNAVHVRDSKDPSATPLTFSPEEWAAFLHGVRTTNDYDLPAHLGQSE
jgi:hypothetical protein